MEEHWKRSRIKGYLVSTLGTIQHEEIFGPIPQQFTHDGYVTIRLRLGITAYMDRPVHRVVCAAFHKNPLRKEQVNHKNGIKHDNRPDNLEWCTPSENLLHAVKTGLSRWGERNHNTKLTVDTAILIKALCMLDLNKKTIAQLFNVGLSTVININKNRTWRRWIREKLSKNLAA